MKTKRKLTHAFIKKDYSDLEKRTEIYDTDVKGLVLRITKTGHKSFAFRYWYNGQSRQVTIEKADQISLKKARDIARDYRELIRQGKDPAMERRENLETKPKTLLQVIDEYKEKHFKKLKQTTIDDYERRLNYFINGYGKNRLKRPITNYKRVELLNWLEDVADGAPTNAQRLQALLSSVFTFAINRGYTQVNIVKGISFKALRDKAEPKQENVALDEEQIRRLWLKFDEYQGPAGGMFKLMMIFGLRARPIRLMKWEDLDLTYKIWTVLPGDTKTNKKKVELPIPEMAIDLLRQLKKKTGNKRYVFNSDYKSDEPIVHPSKAAQRIKERSGVSDFNPHSMRTTFITWSHELEIPSQITSRIVNHGKDPESNSVTEIYNKYNFMPQKRKALNKWNAKLEMIVNEKTTNIHKIA